MFVSIYFPYFDARKFYSERTICTRLPFWPTPDIFPNAFQRNLGAIAQRPLGGVRGWAAESNICEVRSVKISTNKNSNINKNYKLAFRRFYSDGDCGLQFSIGFSAPNIHNQTIIDQCRTLKEIFSLTLSTRHQPGCSFELKESRKLIAELFASGTTKGNRSESYSERVYYGRPLIIVENSKANPCNYSNNNSQITVSSDKISISDLSRSLGYDIDCPIIGINIIKSRRYATRSTRIIIARLYLELFVFERCIALTENSMSARMDSDGRAHLLRRLALSGTRLVGQNAPVITQGTNLYNQLQEVFATVHRPGQIDALLQTLQRLQARPNLVTSVKSAVELTGILNFDMQATSTGVINVTTYNNYGQVGAMGDHAQASHFNQLEADKSNVIDLPLLAKQLAVLQAEMQKEAKTGAEYGEIALVAQAKEAAEQGDNAGMLSHLTKAGQWVLGMAEKISVGLVVAVIKEHLGHTG